MIANGTSAYREELADELIDGEIVLMSPAPINHIIVSGNIYRIFGNYLKGKQCVPLADGALVYLTEKDHFIPDFMVVCDRSRIQQDGVHGAPDLVAEVLSPSTARRDRSHKKEVYAKCGVQEYWLVNSADKSVEIYRTNGSEFVFHDVYTVYPDWMLENMTDAEHSKVITSFRCSLFDGLEISLDDIFSGLLP